MKKITRTVIATILCSAILLSGASCSNDTERQEKELLSSVCEDTDIKFNNVVYFACYQIGEINHVALVGYKHKSIFASSEEKEEKFYKIDYEVSFEDYSSLQEATGSFEAIYPFKQEVLQKLNHITKSYNPTDTNIAFLNDNGEQILNDISN